MSAASNFPTAYVSIGVAVGGAGGGLGPPLEKLFSLAGQKWKLGRTKIGDWQDKKRELGRTEMGSVAEDNL